MTKIARKCLLLAVASLLVANAVRQERITVYLIGDSTMADKRPGAFPETGWGTPFKSFFNSSVTIDNRAVNGRSTKSFIEEGLWHRVEESLQPGDYVLIQFGHNDEVKEKVGRYTTPEQFKDNLRMFVSEARKKEAIPILLSPVARRKFDDAGNVVDTHPEYSPLVHHIAAETKTPFIDLDTKSRELLTRFGEEHSKYLFLQLKPGEHPNYPGGKNDNTHFSELGARLVAQIVLAEIVALRLNLRDRVVNHEKMKSP